MPLVEIPAAEALARFRSDPAAARWPDHRAPATRLKGVIEVGCSPSFEIGRGDRIFTIGSCFARNIEARLAEVGFSVEAFNSEVDQALGALGEAPRFLNRYHAGAIAAELDWALGAGPPPEDHVLFELADGRRWDGFSEPRNPAGVAPEQARAARDYLTGLFAKARDCRIVVITLGLAEAWRDLASGLRLNITPPARLVEGHAGRFVLDVLDYGDVLADLERIHALLARAGHPDFRMLVTVSPVPLKSSFRPGDVMAANSYSKAVQRAAVEAFVLRHDNVDYFPSFEAVTLSERDLVFQRDNRHVEPAAVSQIVDRFLRAYAPWVSFEAAAGPTQRRSLAPDALRAMLKSATVGMRGGDFAKAAQILGEAIELFEGRQDLISSAELRMRWGKCLHKTGRTEAAIEQHRIAAGAEDEPRFELFLKCADRLLAWGDATGAKTALAAAAARGAPAGEIESREGALKAARLGRS